MPSNPHIELKDFQLSATPNQTIQLNDFKGHTTLLYFYPKDNTPGCSQQGQDLRDHYAQFQKLGVQIFGVSKDSLTKHQNFKAKYDFPFELIADPDEVLCQMFDVIKLKKNFGKEYYGIERSSFLIDPQLNVTHAWRKVKVNGHVADLLNTLQNLNPSA